MPLVCQALSHLPASVALAHIRTTHMTMSVTLHYFEVSHHFRILKPLSQMNSRQYLENCIRTLSTFACSHMQHGAGDYPCQMYSHMLEIIFALISILHVLQNQ